MMKRDFPKFYRCAITGIKSLFLLILIVSPFAKAEVPASAKRLSTERNQASQRYEINQTFDGMFYSKDNNIWAYNQQFADLFGMPKKYIEPVEGIVAAAFRIENASYEECGFGGNAQACRKVEQCLIDLYFDESKTPLPWATDIQLQWFPWYSSVRWLLPLDKREKRFGMAAPDTPHGVIRNGSLSNPIVAFADPVTKREAIFTTNHFDALGDDDSVSGSMTLIGYTRNFYQTLSVVNLQFGCGTFSRKKVNIRLDAIDSGPFGTVLAKFNRIVLPEGIVDRIKELQKLQSEKNAVFYRSLFAPPLGTRAIETNTSKP
jgi:hypothetical protein